MSSCVTKRCPPRGETVSDCRQNQSGTRPVMPVWPAERRGSLLS